MTSGLSELDSARARHAVLPFASIGEPLLVVNVHTVCTDSHYDSLVLLGTMQAHAPMGVDDEGLARLIGEPSSEA